MKTQDLLASWSSLSFAEIGAQLEAGENKEVVEQLFGPNEVAEMRSLMATPRTLSERQREAVVLLPGLMGSLLSSIRGVTTLLWINPAIFLNGQSRYLELNQDGSGDMSPNIEAVPISLEKVVYLKIGLALSRQVDLYEFPYDWRRPIEWNAAAAKGTNSSTVETRASSVAAERAAPCILAMKKRSVTAATTLRAMGGIIVLF